jgi:hypothetical protein
MSKELDTWNSGFANPEDVPQQPLYSEVHTVDQLFDRYPDAVEQDIDNDKPCSVIPEFAFYYLDSSKKQPGDGVRINAFFFRYSDTYGEENKYCSITKLDPKTEPVIQRLLLNRSNGLVLNSLDVDTQFTDNDLFKAVVTNAVSSLENRQMNIDIDRHDQEEERLRQRRHRTAGVIALVSTLAVGAVAYGVDSYLNNRFTSEHTRSAAAVRAFDATGFNIPGNGFKVAQIAITPINPAMFKTIPKYEGGNSLSRPRMIKLAEDSCDDFPNVEVRSGDKVHLGIRSNDPLRGQTIGVETSTSGTLSLCSPEDFNTSLNATSVDIAVQVTSGS